MAPDLSIVIIGVGNDFRSDDGCGPAVARHLAALRLPGIRVIDHIGDGTDLINAWLDAEVAFVIDCMRSGSDVGTIRRFDALNGDIPEDILAGWSTHAFSITDTIRLARKVGRLPKQLIVYGIEGGLFFVGSELSSPVAKSIPIVAEKILAEIMEIRNYIAARGLGN